MKKLIILSFILFMVHQLDAQIRVIENSEVARVMDQYAATNRLTTNVPGWRIQLMATTDRRKMEDAKSEFMARYPYIPIDFIHANPYYKLRAGAFATKLETQRVLYMIKSDFPSAYPAQDKNIRPAELVGFQ